MPRVYYRSCRVQCRSVRLLRGPNRRDYHSSKQTTRICLTWEGEAESRAPEDRREQAKSKLWQIVLRVIAKGTTCVILRARDAKGGRGLITTDIFSSAP